MGTGAGRYPSVAGSRPGHTGPQAPNPVQWPQPPGGAGFGWPGQARTGGKGQAPKRPRHVRNKGPQEPLSHLSRLPRAGETEARADQGTPEHPAELGGVTPLCGGGRPQGPDSRAEVSERAGLASLAGWGEASWDTPLGQASRKEDSAPGRESSLGKGPGAGPTLVWGGAGEADAARSGPAGDRIGF